MQTPNRHSYPPRVGKSPRFPTQKPGHNRQRPLKQTSEVPFTFSEKTQKKYTIMDAIRGAEIALMGKRKNVALNMQAVSNRSWDQKITLVELNDIQEAIVQDSLFYAV